jgi:hypothetical protein
MNVFNFKVADIVNLLELWFWWFLHPMSFENFEMISNQKVGNYKAVQLFELYNFGFCHFSIQHCL